MKNHTNTAARNEITFEGDTYETATLATELAALIESADRDYRDLAVELVEALGVTVETAITGRNVTVTLDADVDVAGVIDLLNAADVDYSDR
ncbi:MAG TPA: hypothetical protein VMW08_00275 [Acidimicrobiales bacterium]|nr:hypothetical protein [Acidimicrobiales bacterium]